MLGKPLCKFYCKSRYIPPFYPFHCAKSVRQWEREKWDVPTFAKIQVCVCVRKRANSSCTVPPLKAHRGRDDCVCVCVCCNSLEVIDCADFTQKVQLLPPLLHFYLNVNFIFPRRAQKVLPSSPLFPIAALHGFALQSDGSINSPLPPLSINTHNFRSARLDVPVRANFWRGPTSAQPYCDLIAS